MHKCSEIWKAKTDVEKETNVEIESQGNENNKVGNTNTEWGLNKLGIEPYIKEKYEIYHEALDSPKKYATQYSQDGNNYRNEGKFDEALKCHEKALILNKLMGKEKDVIISYNRIGNLHKYKGEWDKAFEYYKEALKIARDSDLEDQELICLDIIGNLHKEIGEWDEALTYYQESLSFATKNELDRETCISLNLIGNLFQQKGEWKKASNQYIKSLEIAKKNNDKKQISIVYNALGTLHEYKGELNKALRYYENSLEYRKITDKIGYLICYNNLGRIYLKTGNKKKARTFFAKSLDIANRNEIQLTIPIAKNLGELSGTSYLILFKIENLEKIAQINDEYEYIVKNLEKISSNAEKFGARPLEALVYLKLGDVYIDKYEANDNSIERMSDLENAEKYYNMCLKSSDALKLFFQKALAFKGLGIIEYKKEKFYNCKQYFESSLNTLRIVGASFEIQKITLQYAKALVKCNNKFSAEIAAKSIEADAYKCENYEILIKTYLLLGDLAIAEGKTFKDKTFAYYLDSLKISQFDPNTYVKTCYQLIFRMQKMRTEMLKEFLCLMIDENKDIYFDHFLKALDAKILKIQISDMPLPKSLTFELDKFNVTETKE